MKTPKVLMAIVALALFTGVASANSFDPADYVVVGSGDYTGTRTDGGNPDGVETYDGWVSHFALEWVITPNDTAPNARALWKYDYTITAGTYNEDTGTTAQAMSHWILEVSPFVTEENWQDYFLFEDMTPFETGLYEIGDYTGTEMGTGSNPAMPGPLHGLKFNTTEAEKDQESISFSFWSSQQPVWGNFYAKDGRVDGTSAVAYNEGFEVDPLDATGYTRWIATPDTEPGLIIPEPGLSVLALGAFLVGAFARRRRGKNDEDVA